MVRIFGLAASIVLLSCFSNAWSMQDPAEAPKARVVIKAIPLVKAVPAVETTEAKAVETEERPATEVNSKTISKTEFKASHSEVAPLIPKRDGKPLSLNSFRLDAKGNVVAAVTDKSAAENLIQVYGPNLNLIREFPIPFDASAITLDPSGNYIAAGEGKVGKFTSEGTLLKVADAPSMNGDDPEKRRQEIKDQFKSSMEQTLKVYENQINMLQKQIETLNEKKEQDEEKFSSRDERRLTQLTAQLEQYENIKKEFSVEINDAQVDAMMKANSTIPSIAASANDVFVTTSTGMGYEVWRTDTNFENPVKVVSKLSGCCGQMDIFATDEKLLIAENTRFQVGIYDRDGQRQLGFGERAQSGDNGFGSCCNPMNVICCNNGDILTAESSIGKIKRFNSEGEMLGYVGKARIGGGCKHVSIGFDENLDRYYIQYQDKNQICVLIPNAEADEVLAEKREKQKAGEVIVQRLEGAWSVKKDAAKKKKANEDEDNEGAKKEDSAEDNGETIVQGMDDFVENMTNFSDLEFVMDKHHFKTKSANDQPDEDGSNQSQTLTWSVVSFGDDQVRLDLEDADGMVLLGADVKVVNEDTISVRFSYDAIGQFTKAKTYIRKQASE